MIPFTTQKRSYEYLRGHWTDAITAQILVFLFELLLVAFVILSPGNSTINASCALLIDLLMISPLKAGRALFFETLTADGDASRLSLLFRYYRYGYSRTVGWRLLIWTYRVLINVFLCIPPFLLFAFSDKLASHTPTYTDRILSLTLYGFGLLLLICALVTTEIYLLRWSAVPYLFAHTGTLRNAINLSRQITAHRGNTVTSLYLDYAGWLFTFPLIFPWFFVSAVFQTAKAATVHRFLREKPTKNDVSILQPRKKYDRIGR